MPLVTIRRNPRKITDARLEHIIAHLPVIIAGALTCREGGLTSSDIMIEASDTGPFDTNVKDISIVVYAHRYPERVADLEVRQQAMSRMIVAHLPDGVSWYVWVFLLESSYGSDTTG